MDGRHITLAERGTTEEDQAELQRATGLSREQLNARLHPLAKLGPSWTPGRISLIAGSNVGTVQIGALRFDVRPRLAAAEMVSLLRFTLGGDAKAWQRSQIAPGSHGIDELLATVFADELTALRQMGLSRLYVNRVEALPALRGRPDFLASFPWNDRGMATITCRFHELTCDNLDNQLLGMALQRATLMETSVPTRRRLMEHRQVWSEIASPLKGDASQAFSTARERYTRLSEHYRLAHNLAELIVLGRQPSHLFERGTTRTGGVCVDMASLFERFVERLIRERLRPMGLRVESQETDRTALRDAFGFTYARIRPDLVVYREDRPVAVVDSKYKEYWPAAGDSEPKQRISNEDLYQLFFYAQRLQLRHDLESPPAAFIVAPLPAQDERDRPVIDARYTVVQWQAGATAACSVSLLLLPLTDTLRHLARGLSDGEPFAALDPLWRV